MSVIRQYLFQILQTVLSYLEEEDLWECRKVSNLWRELIDKGIGVDLWVGRPTEGIWSNYAGRPFGPLSLIKEYGIHRCFMSNVEQVSSPALVDAIPNLKWKNPGTLLYLWIDGFISSVTLTHLTRDLSRLHTLELHLSALGPGFDVSKLSLTLPSLELFTIQVFATTELTFPDLGATLCNLIKMLSTLFFPRLKSTTINLPFVAGYFQRLNHSILEFLIRNGKQLKVFQLSYESTCDLEGDCTGQKRFLFTI